MSSRGKATPRKPKAAKEVEKQARQLSNPAVFKNVGRAIALLVIAGVSSPISQLSLSPVYGSIPASLHHQRFMTGTAILAIIAKNAIGKRFSAKSAAGLIAVIAYWIPVIQFYAFGYSDQLGIEWGPSIIESTTYFPLLLLCMYAASDLLESLDLTQFNLNPRVAEIAPPLASYVTISSIAKFTASSLPGYIGTHVSFTRVGLQLLVGSVSAALIPSRIILLAAPAILHTLFVNPHYPSGTALQKANATLFESQNFTILARQESLTGYVSVLENDAPTSFRLLRCDHSLLGGEWQVTPLSASRGQNQPETIFQIFVMLEAVRLMEHQHPDTAPVPDSRKAALNIGLGIGTAPNALITHGINTTIVELDPVVHHYATKYFALNPNHTAVIDDAILYVEEKSRANPASFNYIIHDVFTGGAEPVYLFTQDFFLGLKTLLTEDGVVAINYAGDLSLPATRLVLNTIHSVFPACRLYRDSPQAPDWKEGDPDFINMVVFCVKNDFGKGKKAVKFRKADEKDFRGSIARKNALRPRADQEVKFVYTDPKDGGKIMKKEDVGELEKWHEQGAVSHWRIMRTVLPAGVWEMW